MGKTKIELPWAIGDTFWFMYKDRPTEFVIHGFEYKRSNNWYWGAYGKDISNVHFEYDEKKHLDVNIYYKCYELKQATDGSGVRSADRGTDHNFYAASGSGMTMMKVFKTKKALLKSLE